MNESKPIEACREPSLSQQRTRIRWPAITAFVLAVLGFLPFSAGLIWIYGPWISYLSSHAHLDSPGWSIPLRLIWFWFMFPPTTASIPFGILGIARIRRYGRCLAEAGSHGFLMWAWLACAFTLLLAVSRTAQLLCFGSWSIYF